MRVWARLLAAGIVAWAGLLFAPAAGAQTLACPPSVGGIALSGSSLQADDPAATSTLTCSYGEEDGQGGGGDVGWIGVEWDATEAAISHDVFKTFGFQYMCMGAEDMIGQPAGDFEQWTDEVTVLQSSIASPGKRATAATRTWDWWDPPTDVDHGAFVSAARDLLARAEALAIPCQASAGGLTPGGHAGAGSGRGSGEGTPGVDTAGEPGTGSNRRTAGLHVAAGAGLTVLSGAGSVVAGRRPRGPAVTASAPAPEVLYSGPEAVQILQEAGLLQPVRGEDGALIGYRPVGDLQRFIDQTPQWQPRLGKPVKTPGGTATHLGAVAFQERPDGLIGDLTIAVREAPAARTGSGGGQAGAAGALADAPIPGEPLAERLGRAWARAQAYGIPFEAALEAPDVPGQPGPGRAPAQQPARPQAPQGPAPKPDPLTAASPPVGLDQVPAWLAKPGWKSIKPSDIFRMFPQYFGPGGALTSSPYAGAVPKVTIQDGSFTVEVNSDSLFVPDLRVRGTLTPSPSGRSLVPTLEEVTLGDRPFGDRLEHQRNLSERLEKLTKPVGDAGLRFGEVRMDGGQIQILVERP